MFGLNPYVMGGAAIAFALALGFGGVQTMRLNHAKADLATVRVELKAAQDALAVTEAQRTKDQAAATANVNDINADCRADVLTAAQAGRTIERIVNAPAPKPGALRGRISAGELCGIAGEATCPD